MSNNDDEVGLEPLIEGVILEDRPFTDAAEAERFVARTFELLYEGTELQEKAQQMLAVGASRRVWEPLGYENYESLLSERVEHTFATKLTREARRSLVAQLRPLGVDAGTLAEATGYSRSSIIRDSQEMQESGEMVIPEKIVGADGKAHPSRQAPRRVPFPKTWNSAIQGALTKTGTLDRLVNDDDRWRKHVVDLGPKTRSDIDRMITVLIKVRDEMDKVRPPDPPQE